MTAEAFSGEQVAAEAENIIDNVQQTRYQYPPYLIDNETGTYYVDCCGFVSYVLESIAIEHYEMIPPVPGWPVPQAFKYYEFFTDLTTTPLVGWRLIPRLANCVAGDIIAWRLLSPDSTGDTGHVFIVAGDPVVLESGDIAIPAYDSSNVLHYDDSRFLPDGQQTTGVGTGTINFKVDRSGGPAAFQFGPGDCFHAAPIAIGRLEPIKMVG